MQRIFLLPLPVNQPVSAQRALSAASYGCRSDCKLLIPELSEDALSTDLAFNFMSFLYFFALRCSLKEEELSMKYIYRSDVSLKGNLQVDFFFFFFEIYILATMSENDRLKS